MKCVKCSGELEKVTVGGVEVDQCPKCSGIWFDFGELQKILGQPDLDRLKGSAPGAAASAAQDAVRGHCPRCGGAGNMVPVTDLHHQGVHIDTCLVCYGQWLDGGELEVLRKKGLFKSAAGFFRKLLKRKK